MQNLQQGFKPLEFSDLASESSTTKEGSVSRRVKFSSRVSLSRLNRVVPEVPRCVLRTCKFPRHSSFGDLNSQVAMEQLATPPTTPKAGPLQGLGEILNDGYELTEHVVIDENHTFEGNNDVIEKLITGFKTFKEGVFKYVVPHLDLLNSAQ